MAYVTSKDRLGNVLSLDQMLRKFKKQVDKDGTMIDFKKHEYFVPKSVARKLKSARHQKMLKKIK